MADLNLISEYKCFDGTQSVHSHRSQTCNIEMRFAVYQPPQTRSQSVPVLYFLSGLTCTEDNFITKAGAQRYAAEHGLMLVVPDTSPRNTGIEGEDKDWDLGTGASFYLDATAEPWRSHYQMYSYVVKELPALIAAHFPIQPEKQGIFGHSMGGHGALVCGLRNPELFKSISAFAPIVAPMQSDWGQKAFTSYLGTDKETWRNYDASELVLNSKHSFPILIDQGIADRYLQDLMPEVFERACDRVGQQLCLRYQEGYDHSYYFISTFVGDHIRHHAEVLCG
jgi:S-formylglutathione hydrolase